MGTVQITAESVVARGKKWTVDSRTEMGPNSRKHLLASGWDGFDYFGRSPRGTVALFYRCAKTQELRFVVCP